MKCPEDVSLVVEVSIIPVSPIRLHRAELDPLICESINLHEAEADADVDLNAGGRRNNKHLQPS